jgi:hypothetical protein
MADSNKDTPVNSEKAFSRYWRKNRSHLEATELATVLAAMRKVAAHIGRNVKPVYWRGMSASPTDSIVLNPDAVQGTYPVPFQKIDVLVGEVVREGFLCIEWSDWVTDQVVRKTSFPLEWMKDYLSSFISVAEDLYIDERVGPTVWRLYLSKYWKSIAGKLERDPSLPPSASSLACVWRKRLFLQTLPPHLHHYYDDLVNILTQYSDAIRQVKNLSTLTERRTRRVEIYLEIWGRISSIIMEWETPPFYPEGVNIYDEGNPNKAEIPELKEKKEDNSDDAKEKEEESPGLEEELAPEISSRLDDGTSDLTEHLSVILNDPQTQQMNTIFSRAVARCNVSADQSQVRRLKRIFQKQQAFIRRSKKRGIIRNVDMGKIDARRLYRVPLADGKIFKRRDISGTDYSWNINIVADASASMAGKKATDRPWQAAEKTFVSLTEAAKGFSNHLEVFGYQEQTRQCSLLRLYQEGELYTIEPSGRTPTGQAIMAAAMLMKKDDRRKMIIHITDGAANCGINVLEAIEYCQKNKIELITIGCGCNLQTKQFLLERYPHGTVYLMDDIRNLSKGLENLFRDKLLKKAL